jgi:hypothetical protein
MPSVSHGEAYGETKFSTDNKDDLHTKHRREAKRCKDSRTKEAEGRVPWGLE